MTNRNVFDQSYYIGFWRNLRSRKFHPLNDFRVWYILRNFQPENIFDAGCGLGLFLEEMSRRKVSVAGCDISGYAIRQLPSTIRKRCFRHDIRMPFNAGKTRYDVVSCIDIFEHLKICDIQKVIPSLMNISKRYIYLEITVKEDVLFINSDATHISKFSRERWFDILKKMLHSNQEWVISEGPCIPFLRNGIFLLHKNKV